MVYGCLLDVRVFKEVLVWQFGMHGCRSFLCQPPIPFFWVQKELAVCNYLYFLKCNLSGSSA